MTIPRETIVRDKNTIAGEDNSAAAAEHRLRTADIAGAGRADEGDAIEVESSPHHDDPELQPLFAAEAEQDFRRRWRDIQGGFVDEPRSAVEQADQLVAQLMQRLAQSFSEQRSNLEKQWDASAKISTEDLRIALQRYRSFFERLLSI